MATTQTIGTTYAGEKAGKYISKILLNNDSLNSGIFTVKQNIKYKQVIKTAELGDNLVQDGSCDFTPTSSATLNERIIEPKELQINLQLCKSDFRQDWDAISMGMGAFDQLPKDVNDFIITEAMLRAKAKLEVDLYSGNRANNGEIDGIVTRISTDANLPAGQEVAGTTVTAANVIDELGKIVDAMPTRLLVNPMKYIVVDAGTYQKYARALGGFATGGLGANGIGGQGTQWWKGEALMFENIPVLRGNGLAANTGFASYQDNIWFGTGLLNDWNQVKVIDMEDIDGSQNVRFIARFTADTNYGFAADIVTYGITNSAN